jgi:hypothetical protein
MGKNNLRSRAQGAELRAQGTGCLGILQKAEKKRDTAVSTPFLLFY